MIIQLCGVSGAGKTTIANLVKEATGCQVIDGDEYRKTVCKDLGFSRMDRVENVRRLMRYAHISSASIVLVAAINPYDTVRKEAAKKYGAKIVWVRSNATKERDTKGLYASGVLPDGQFEEPVNADLILDTDKYSAQECADKLIEFIST